MSTTITRIYGRTKHGKRIRRSRIEIYAAVRLYNGNAYYLDFVADLPGNLCRMTDLGSMIAAQIKTDCPDALQIGIAHIDVQVFENGRRVAQRGFWPIDN